MMETDFPRMYVDPNLQQYRRAMSRRAGNRDGGKYIQEMVNSWLSAFIYSDFVCAIESAYAVARVPRIGTTALDLHKLHKMILDTRPSCTCHRCVLVETPLLLKQLARVRSPAGTIYWLRISARFTLNRKTNVRKFGPHSSPAIIWPFYVIQIIHHQSTNGDGL